MDNPPRQLETLGRGIWGACVAWVLVTIGVWLFLHVWQPGAMRPPELLPEFGSAYEDTTPQKAFYASFFVLGSVCAYLAVRFRRPRYLTGGWGWVGLLAFVPLAVQCLAGVFGRTAGVIWWLATVGCVALPAGLSWRTRAREAAAPPGLNRATTPPSRGSRPWLPTIAPPGLTIRQGPALDLAAWVVFALLLWPSSVTAVAAQVGLDMHPVCFFIGPATYFYGNGLVPGRDYFTQYGIGQGFIFSFFLGDSAQATLRHYVYFAVGLSWLVFGVAYLVLRSLFGSRAWAFGITVTALILNFCSTTPWNWPSSWVIRYPLLFVFVGLAARAFTSGQRRGYLAAGICAGLSVFWNTETGLYLLATGMLAYVLLRWGREHFLRNGLAFGLAALVAFFGTSGLVYGHGVFSTAFAWGLIEPLMLYGAGLGGVVVEWKPGWNYLCAVAVPVLVTATAGWSAARSRESLDTHARRQTGFLLLLALVANCLLLKWVNRSLTVVWNVNAFPALVVVAWWWQRALLGRLWNPSSEQDGLQIRPYRLGAWATVGLAVAFLFLVRDARWRYPLAARAYASYPSLLRALVTGACAERWPKGLGEVAAHDVELIRQYSKPGERVAVVSRLDWVYLVAARRAPKLDVVPSTWVFLDSQIDRSLEGADQIFVEIDGEGRPVLPPITFGRRLAELLQRECVLRTKGTNLALFVRPAFARGANSLAGPRETYTPQSRRLPVANAQPDR
jgi:hypothetical protein